MSLALKAVKGAAAIATTFVPHSNWSIDDWRAAPIARALRELCGALVRILRSLDLLITQLRAFAV